MIHYLCNVTMKYNKNNKLRVFTAFSGYDSQCLALNRLKELYPEFDYTLVGWSEIDDSAIQAHNALFEDAKTLNLNDITKIMWTDVPDFDLFTYSFPCTDISQAGKQAGLSKESGTRSSLLWECKKAIEIKRPRYLLMENVAALVSKKFIKDFHEWLQVLDRLGYESFSQVLNAKHYGVPQNRERIFVVSILRTEEEKNPKYYFPKPEPLQLCLADVLEEDVDEKYFLSDEMLARFCEKSMEEEYLAGKPQGTLSGGEDEGFEDFFVCQ